MKARPQGRTGKPVAGLDARRLAVRYLRGVGVEGRFLDELVTREAKGDIAARLDHRDRALARLLAATVLRRSGQIDAVLGSFLHKPLDKSRGNIWPILQVAAAQLLFLDTPAHAAINIAVEQCRSDRAAHRFDRLANALLRKLAADGHRIVAGQDGAKLNTADWMWERWVAAYGPDLARAIAEGNQREAPLDLSLVHQGDAGRWADRLSAVELATGSLRRRSEGRIEDLPGFEDGAWWVQDAAAALPARLLGDVAGKSIADVCAAPGGKTAQLVSAGAAVTSIDQSQPRLERLRANLERLSLEARLVQADATSWSPAVAVDALLVDAPCTATGTIRRHPDIPRLKKREDIKRMADLQERLLANCWQRVRPGGMIVYCTCSLEPEEGVEQIERLLAREPALERVPVRREEIAAEPDWITAEGDLRTLPCHSPGGAPDHLPGMDGFYAARLRVRPSRS